MAVLIIDFGLKMPPSIEALDSILADLSLKMSDMLLSETFLK